MVKYENECVGCKSIGLPCMGSSCPNRHVERHYCDRCETEDVLYDWDGEELCEDCIEEELKETAVTDEKTACKECGETEALYEYDGKILCLSCILNFLDKI